MKNIIQATLDNKLARNLILVGSILGSVYTGGRMMEETILQVKGENIGSQVEQMYIERSNPVVEEYQGKIDTSSYNGMRE